MTVVEDLAGIPLFERLAPDARRAAAASCERRSYRPGELLLRRGAPGTHFFAIVRGRVEVRTARATRAAVLGPGEVFGEMALLSGAPVSANVVATTETVVHRIPRSAFDRLFADEPRFQVAIAELLADRLRRRTATREREPVACIVAGPVPDDVERSLVAAIERYVAVDRVSAAVGAALVRELGAWRESASGDRVLLARLEPEHLAAAAVHLRTSDAVVLIDDASDGASRGEIGDGGEAGVARLRIATATRRAALDEPWCYRLPPGAVSADTPVLERLARWITRREIGIALGAGAARGFAHLGVLGALDRAGVPVDCLAGSSIGGIVALLYAMTGSAEGAHRIAHETIGSNDAIRDVRWFPRGSLLRGRKIRRNARRISEGKRIGELELPAFAVATDLAGGGRVVLDRGDVADALVGTAAIPGLLPPVRVGDRWLADGGLVSRVPVAMLERRRCGVRIAVNVLPDPGDAATLDADSLERTLRRPLGMGRLLARSWDLLGFWHGAADTADADVLIEPATAAWSGYDFDTAPAMEEAGRAATEAVLPTVQRAVAGVLEARSR